jgi:hypothetical protein
LDRAAYDNDLTGEACSEEDFATVQRVVDHFGLQNQREYHDVYLETDVLALADCIQASRDGWFQNYGLDMLHCVTGPAASYQAMLKETGVNFELITEENGGMDLMEAINANIRGGVSCIFKPFAEANNPRVLRPLPAQLGEFLDFHAMALSGVELDWNVLPREFVSWCKENGYDHERPLTWIEYLDANSLYPTTMAMALPIGDYRLEPLPDDAVARVKHIKTLVELYNDGQAKGYFIEVSFRVPERLHDILDYPPVAKREIERSEISQYQRSVLDAIGGASAKSVKLFPSLGVQRKVLHHVGLLKFWMNMGIEIFEVHRLWRFRQTPWMRSYINGMAAKRASSKDAVEKECIKKAMNSLYGKMLQDKSRQCNLTPYTDSVKFAKAAAKGRAKDFHIVQMDSEGSPYFFGLVETDRRGGPVLDTPRAAGFAILELSKLLILQMHYGFFKKLYGDKAKLLMTDTDSLVYQIEAEDPMRDMIASTDTPFDLLNALPDRELERTTKKYPELAEGLIDRLLTSKGKLGALKLEQGCKFIASYVGLAAKMYSMLMIGEDGVDESIRKGKGVPARVLKKEATHESYRSMLLTPGPCEATFRTFRSFSHSIVQLEVKKRMLTAFNDKVFQLSALDSRPLGHWKNQQAAAGCPGSSSETTAPVAELGAASSSC